MTNKWIKLTAPDDKPVWFSVDQLVTVEPAVDGEGHPDAKTRITTTSSSLRFVKEAVDTVEQML